MSARGKKTKTLSGVIERDDQGMVAFTMIAQKHVARGGAAVWKEWRPSRETRSRPFTLVTDDGQRILIEPQGEVQLHWPLDDEAEVHPNGVRTRTARVAPAARVRVEGVELLDVDESQGPYRAGPRRATGKSVTLVKPDLRGSISPLRSALYRGALLALWPAPLTTLLAVCLPRHGFALPADGLLGPALLLVALQIIATVAAFIGWTRFAPRYDWWEPGYLGEVAPLRLELPRAAEPPKLT